MLYPNRGVFSYDTNRDENTYVLSHRIKVHPVGRVNTIDVGYFNENTESHAVNEQDEGWKGYMHSIKNTRTLFITSDDLDGVDVKWYYTNMKNEREVSDFAVDNMTQIKEIRRLFLSNEITREEAYERAKPIIDAIDARGREIAKKHKRRYNPLNFTQLMRG